ncbi:hypothetical protein [Moorena sp. SIO4A5]|uniref:hypothetical protein n=1 Tax=Moorena sp. SIO4A5 TaxID=2607838 RepID=UPI0013C5E10B|nr:hypothetical protein [Moorena sp. SIO4A5]
MIITSKTPRISFLLFPVPCSLFPVPCSPFPIPCSLFPIPCSLFPISPFILKFSVHQYSRMRLLERNIQFLLWNYELRSWREG